MALMPKRVKHRKQQRGTLKGFATRGNFVAYGEFGLQSLEYAWIPGNVIEASRIASNRVVSPLGGRIFIRIFPHKPITKSPAETRMGKGKGAVDQWVMNIKPGRIIFEMAGVPHDIAREALTLAMHKLPFKTKIITAEMSNEIF
jgi:large subunit ribosomal protein L16